MTLAAFSKNSFIMDISCESCEISQGSYSIEYLWATNLLQLNQSASPYVKQYESCKTPEHIKYLELTVSENKIRF